MVEDFGTTALPSILGRLRQDHPHFELTVETGLGIDLVRRLETDSLDLILTKRVSDRYDSPVLCRQNLVWVGRPGVFEAGDDVEPLVLFPAPAPTREIILRTLRENDLRWSIRFESASITSLRAARPPRVRIVNAFRAEKFTLLVEPADEFLQILQRAAVGFNLCESERVKRASVPGADLDNHMILIT